ncbi:DIS3-like exonuclease 2 [Nymphon striatum]|nr:DIS3-like exonuclease 2 [Nymphon striatum]
MSLAEIQKGLKKGEVLEGVLRINQRNYEDSYISSPEGQSDIYIGGMHDRNRAMHGDVVAIRLKSPELWRVSASDFFIDTVLNMDWAIILGEMIIISNNILPNFENSWGHFGDIATQPHSIEILGIESLQEEIMKFKQAYNKENNSKSEEKIYRGPASSDEHITFNEWQTDSKSGVPNVSASGDSAFIVSPEEILMDGDGQYIGSIPDNIISNGEQDSTHPITIVAPDQLSECDNSISGDAASFDSLNIYNTEDKKFFSSQLNALNNNDPAQDISVGLLNVDHFNESCVESTEKNLDICEEPESSTKNHEPGSGKKKRKKNRRRKSKAKTLNSEKENSNKSNCPAQSLSETNFDPQNDEKTKEFSEKNKCNRRKNKKNSSHSDAQADDKHFSIETSIKNKEMNCIKTGVDSPKVHSINIRSCQEYTVGQLLQHPHADKFVQRTAEIVGIIERKHPMIAAGHIKLQQNNSNFAVFSPNDSRVPRILIPISDCPSDFMVRSKDYEKSLFVAVIKEWKEGSVFAHGNLNRNLGQKGDIEAETEALLIDNGIDYSEFSEKVMESLSIGLPYTIPEDEIKKRKDFRNDCVFTIDPSTARDLDDAVSCKAIGDGTIKISVHIADVSFFVPEGSPVDKIAKERATSVYLVQKVVPMLPRILCEQLCSLNPGEDKLTLSVEWTVSEEGDILDQWFGRGIINSCVKLSYEHAQDMIECDDFHKFGDAELPPVTGNFDVGNVLKSVKILNKMAKKLRDKRFESGALKIDQIKPCFNLNRDTGMPYGCSTYELKDSNRLIEEFMLLANMTVAHFLYKKYPDSAFLRCHAPPQKLLMEKTTEMCGSFGICINDESSKTLQISLSSYNGEDVYSKSRYAVLLNMYSKPMNSAKYFSSRKDDDKDRFHHFALNVPLYTHFTSPIRRYADVIVHRQLAAALGIGRKLKLPPKGLGIQAEVCNDKKYNAKRASEISAEMFLGLFIQECGPLKVKGMVIGVMNRSFDVLLLSFGSIRRIYCDKLGLKRYSFSKTLGVSELTLIWPGIESCDQTSSEEQSLVKSQVITLFSPVDVSLVSGKEQCSYSATIIRPVIAKEDISLVST